MVRNTFLPKAMSTAAQGNAPRWRMDGGRRFAPEGQRNVATGEAWCDHCRTRRNPWFPGASADSPGRGGRDASAALPLPGRLLVSVPRAAGSASRRPRRGFTLVELLVTITIITMLAGMVLGGLSMARTSAREMKTKATIAKLDEIVMRMYAGYANRRVPIDTSGMAPGLAATARRNSRADLLRMEMPNNFAEISTGPTSGYGLQQPALQLAYKSLPLPGNLGGVNPATESPEQRLLRLRNESAVCLYRIVSIANARDMEHFSPDEIGNVGGLPVFVDAWGKPINFLRWPTGFATSDIQDINDPTRPFLPLVVSAGADTQLGIEAGTGAPLDNSFSDYGAQHDNIHNHRLEIR
ncbi:MAG: prepilin-type N-terminal cleavage/methylation domain-containing protein [Patescibacteria group bacterium]|nr:prepilin-type N-terminal cleavage/methylation domain-containing protein [Patescibacteria group bacterium]